MNTTMVVPCYNEADRIDLMAFRRFARDQREVRFLFVNDGSTDSTADLLRSFVTRESFGFQFLDLPQNCGKAEAVRLGILHCLNQNNTCVGFIDADLATPLSEVLRLKAAITAHNNIEMAIGIRLPLLGRRIRRNAIRSWVGNQFANVASRMLGLSLSDTQCGAKLFRVTENTGFLFATPFVSRWIFDVEIFARFLIAYRPEQARARIYELPLEEWSEIKGSKLKARDFLKAFLELGSIYVRYFLSASSRDQFRCWRDAHAPENTSIGSKRRAA